MTDKKWVMIVALLTILVIAEFGWLIYVRVSTPDNTVPTDNTSWTEIFPGYESYLDDNITYITISGTSMEPTFGENDLIMSVEVENKAELIVGEIIVFAHPTLAGHPPMAHRIYEAGTMPSGAPKFRTKGDNMSEPDQHWVEDTEVQGLVIGVIHNAVPG